MLTFELGCRSQIILDGLIDLNAEIEMAFAHQFGLGWLGSNLHFSWKQCIGIAQGAPNHDLSLDFIVWQLTRIALKSVFLIPEHPEYDALRTSLAIIDTHDLRPIVAVAAYQAFIFEANRSLKNQPWLANIVIHRFAVHFLPKSN